MAYLSTRHDGRDGSELDSQCIREALSVHDSSECTIQNQGLARIGGCLPKESTNLRKLDISFNAFSHLDGIEQFSQLRVLHCYSSHLHDIESLRGMKKLEVLLVQQNAIDTIPPFFTAFQKLKELRIDHNVVRSVGSSISGCSSLQTLDLSFNRLESIRGISGLQNLTELRVCNNSISSIQELRALPSLVELDISYNMVQTLDGIEHVPTIEVIKANHNRLSSLRIPKIYNSSGSKSKTLSEEDGKRNMVGLQQLTEVYVASNRICTLVGMDTLGTRIEKLDVSGNKLGPDTFLLYATDDVCTGSTRRGIDYLLALSVLNEVNIDKNSGFSSPSGVEQELNKSMGEICLELRDKCKYLSIIDGEAFVARGSVQNHEKRTDGGAAMFTTWPSIGNTSNNESEINNGAHDDDTIGDVDVKPDSCHRVGSDEGRSSKEHTSNIFAAKVVKEIKTMEELEEMESSIRSVLTSTRDILQSIFLLEDTPDGLYSSVPSDQLPTSEQFATIASTSSSSSSSSSRIKKSNAVSSLELTKSTENTNHGGDGKGPILSHLASDTEENDLGEKHVVVGHGEVKMTDIAVNAYTDADYTLLREVSKIPSVTEQEIQQPTNKEYVQALVNEIKFKVANEKIFSPNSNSSSASARHDRDLPHGSGLTRYGSKIRKSLHFEQQTPGTDTGRKSTSAHSTIEQEMPADFNVVQFSAPSFDSRHVLPSSQYTEAMTMTKTVDPLAQSEPSEDMDSIDVTSDSGISSPNERRYNASAGRRRSEPSHDNFFATMRNDGTSPRSPDVKTLNTRAFKLPSSSDSSGGRREKGDVATLNDLEKRILGL